jgi:hypothetical protein
MILCRRLVVKEVETRGDNPALGQRYGQRRFEIVADAVDVAAIGNNCCKNI